MRFIIASVLAVHGIAHLVGFIAAWQLMTLPELPYRTTVLGGGIDVGTPGIRVVGILWLAAAVACVIAGIALWLGTPWAMTFAFGTVIASLAMCVVGWPDARIGLVLNLILIAALVLTPRFSASL